jgi:uncharacterized damage-inducible protein DinB
MRIRVADNGMKDSLESVRAQLARVLDWQEAHVGFAKAVEGLPARARGAVAAGFEHSPWQLLEHIRLAQNDILDFCLNPDYAQKLKWPDDYWPSHPEPPSAARWEESIRDFNADREELKVLVRNPDIDLMASVPTGSKQQTYLRAIMLVIDHNAYHLGQLVAVRRALGVWK